MTTTITKQIEFQNTVLLNVSKCCGAVVSEGSKFCPECCNRCEFEEEKAECFDYGTPSETAYGNALHNQKMQRAEILKNSLR